MNRAAAPSPPTTVPGDHEEDEDEDEAAHDSEDEVIFFLEEPNLEMDMEKWGDWFDKIKAVREFLSTTGTTTTPTVEKR